MYELRFSKGQALGNDYLVVDSSELPVPLTTELVRGLCDRHRGAGSDGVLVGTLEGGRIRLRIFNPDGSEAEKSGNGLRIFAAYLHGRGVVDSAPFTVELPKDSVEMRVVERLAGGALQVEAEMGRASFLGKDVGYLPVPGVALGDLLDLGDGLSARVNPVSLGNPHCVVIVDELDREDFLRRAPRLATHPAFAAGTNVQFAKVAGPRTVEAWIWERGVGETLASGSSSCAVAAVVSELGLVAARELMVEMRGGSAGITLRDDGMIRLRGPAQIVYRGTVGAEVVEGWMEKGERATAP